MADVDTPATRALNLESAIQSMVLLKNDPVPSQSGYALLPISNEASVSGIKKKPLPTENLLVNTDGLLRPPQKRPITTAACCSRFPLTGALLITSSHWEGQNCAHRAAF